VAPVKAAPKKVESVDSDSSDEDESPLKVAPVKTVDSVSDSYDDDDPAFAPTKVVQPAPKAASKATKAAPKAAPKVASSDDSEEDSDASDEKPVKAKAVAKKKVPAPVAKKPAAKIEVEEDSDEEEEEKPATKKATTSQVKKAKKVEDDDEDEDEEEEVAKPVKQAPKPAAAAEENGQEYEAKIFGLSYQSTEQDIREFLKDCGPINNVNVLKDRNTGKPKGICFIKFGTEAALNEAVTLNGSEFMGRYLEISKAEPRGTFGAQKEGGFNQGNGFNRPAAPAGDSSTCFIGNLSYGTTVETLREFFEDCGPIVDVRIAMDRNTGEVNFQ